MKSIYKITIICLAVMLGLAVIGSPALAQSNPCPNDLINGSCTIRSGEVLNGNMSLFNSDLVIEDGGRLNGNVDSFNSNLQIDGRITGNISTFGGDLTIGASASVNGNVDAVFSNTTIADSAKILGNRTLVDRNGVTNPSNWNVQRTSGSFLGRSLWLFFIALSLAALGLVSVLIFQKPAERMVESITTRPWIAFALGLLLWISLPFALVLMIVTIILIPVALAAVLLLPIVIVFAWVAVGMMLCQLITGLLKWDWPPAVDAAVGTLLLTIVAGLLLFIPCVGWIFLFIFLTTGMGAFIMLFMKFSTPPVTSRPAAPVAPAAPVPPTPPVESALPTPPAPTPADKVEVTPEISGEPTSTAVISDLFPEPPSEPDQPEKPASN